MSSYRGFTPDSVVGSSGIGGIALFLMKNNNAAAPPTRAVPPIIPPAKIPGFVVFCCGDEDAAVPTLCVGEIEGACVACGRLDESIVLVLPIVEVIVVVENDVAGNGDAIITELDIV